ncbi:MAG: RluA family pseudouridine synthase [Acidobacteriota bacterium]
MPSKNMLPKGKRRHSVKAEYRATRTIYNEREAAAREAGTLEEQPEPEPFYETTPNEPIVAGYGLVTTGPNGGKHPKEFADHDKPRYPGLKVEPLAPEITVIEDLEPEDGVRTFTAEPNAAGLRLDAYLAKALPDISRARVQLLIEAGQVTVDHAPMKAKQKLRGGEVIEIEGEPQPTPLKATPEDIPLTIVYEDADLAVIDKPAGMMVHAGAGDSESNRGTLVNALLHHMGKSLHDSTADDSSSGLSQVGGTLRPGIVHRLDKQTSGLIIVAKNDSTHRKLSDMFSNRRLRKVYLALVHGWIEKDSGTIALPIARDLVRRTRMTTRRTGGRAAVSHFTVLERIAGPFGKFTLVEVKIETGRTHQIRVHMQAIGHAVVGDTLYGAPRVVNPIVQKLPGRATPSKPAPADPANPGFALERNFLHAAELEFMHPRTNERLELSAGLPPELTDLLHRVRGEDPNALSDFDAEGKDLAPGDDD